MHKTIIGYFVTYKGTIQHGMWARDKDALKDLLYEHYPSVAVSLRDSLPDWRIIEAQIIFNGARDE